MYVLEWAVRPCEALMSAGVSSGGVARTPMKGGKVFRRFFRNNFERSISPL